MVLAWSCDAYERKNAVCSAEWSCKAYVSGQGGAMWLSSVVIVSGSTRMITFEAKEVPEERFAAKKFSYH